MKFYFIAIQRIVKSSGLSTEPWDIPSFTLNNAVLLPLSCAAGLASLVYFQHFSHFRFCHSLLSQSSPNYYSWNMFKSLFQVNRNYE